MGIDLCKSLYLGLALPPPNPVSYDYDTIIDKTTQFKHYINSCLGMRIDINDVLFFLSMTTMLIVIFVIWFRNNYKVVKKQKRQSRM